MRISNLLLEVGVKHNLTLY